MKFEYKTEKYVSFNTTKMVKEVEVPAVVYASDLMEMDLPQKGQQGWELITVVAQGDLLIAVFKRPVVETQKLGPKSMAISASAVPKKAEPTTSLQVVSRPGGGVAFSTPLPAPTQRDFPSRDFSTGYGGASTDDERLDAKLDPDLKD